MADSVMELRYDPWKQNWITALKRLGPAPRGVSLDHDRLRVVGLLVTGMPWIFHVTDTEGGRVEGGVEIILSPGKALDTGLFFVESWEDVFEALARLEADYREWRQAKEVSA